MSDKNDKNNGSLTPKDADLWRSMTSDVTPIDGKTYLDVDDTHDKTPKIRETVAIPKAKELPRRQSSKEIDRRTDERLRKGKMPIEATLDLHGYRQDEAHEALINFVKASYGASRRCVLVITGKGRMSEGVLRQKVPGWLQASDLSPLILKIYTAQPQHGGQGAFYIYLRKNR